MTPRPGASIQTIKVASRTQFSENSSDLSDLADHFRRGMPPFKINKSTPCYGLPVSWWYPEYIGEDAPQNRDAQREQAFQIEIAKAICTSCPFRAECTEWAVIHNEYGIWGGTFEGTRRKIRKARGLPAGPR